MIDGHIVVVFICSCGARRRPVLARPRGPAFRLTVGFILMAQIISKLQSKAHFSWGLLPDVGWFPLASIVPEAYSLRWRRLEIIIARKA